MSKIDQIPPVTEWINSIPTSRREFISKLGKGAFFASLGIFGAGCEAVNRGLVDRGMVPDYI